MLDSVKITRRQSEIRQTLAGLVGKENAKPEIRVTAIIIPNPKAKLVERGENFPKHLFAP